MSGAGTDYTLTANLGLYKPIANMAVGLWGDLWNSNADALDSAMYGRPFLPLTGGALSGRLTLPSMTLTPLPANAANDAAAATAGVPVGGVYRNGSVLMVRVA